MRTDVEADVVGSRDSETGYSWADSTLAAADVGADILTTGNEEYISPDRKGSIVTYDHSQPDTSATRDSGSEWEPGAFGPTPTAEEFKQLRKAAGNMPWPSYMICAVEFAERASYYGVAQIFSNFVQFPLPEGGNGAGSPPPGSQKTAGALGRGLQASSGVSLSFSFLAYTVPILGGVIADVYLGRYRTICIGVALCGISHVIMAAGAAPAVLQRGQGMAPFIISMLLLAFGAGLFKSNISPMLVDQNPHKKPYVKVLKSGENVIIDPEATIARALLWFYMLVNVGAFFVIATTYSEKIVGYWLAFLEPAIIYFMLPVLLAVMYQKTIKVKPGGSDTALFLKVLSTSIKKNGIFKVGRKGYLDAAKPSVIAANGGQPVVPWSDKFVDDVGRTLVACQIFLFFPLFYMNDSGIAGVQTSQAGTMTTNGAPNDLLNNFNPLAIIVFIPVLNFGIYPTLRRFNINFGRVRRITFGFSLVAINGLIGTILQYRIYKTSPCGYYATECAESDGTVSPISVWSQIPIYVLGAIAECFAQVTAYEMAYSRSPGNMKGLITSLFLFMNALSKAVSSAVTPALRDPYLIWVFAGPTIGGFLLTPLFYWMYRELDNEDESKMDLYALPETYGSEQDVEHFDSEANSRRKSREVLFLKDIQSAPSDKEA